MAGSREAVDQGLPAGTDDIPEALRDGHANSGRGIREHRGLSRCLDLILHTSRLLPSYGFPVGLDIVDKFAKVPARMSRGVKGQGSRCRRSVDNDDYRAVLGQLCRTGARSVDQCLLAANLRLHLSAAEVESRMRRPLRHSLPSARSRGTPLSADHTADGLELWRSKPTPREG